MNGRIGSPTQLTSPDRGFYRQLGRCRQECHISSNGASRTRALTNGSPALYQLSYETDMNSRMFFLTDLAGSSSASL